MQRSVEIHYGRTFTANKGNYENDKPMWNEKIMLSFNGESPAEVAEIQNREYEEMKKRVDERANAEWEKYRLQFSGLRVREKDGKKYPSVTSIISPEPYTGNPEYGTRGTELHRLIDQFINTGKWQEPQVKLQTLSFDDIKYKEFFTQYGPKIKSIKGSFTSLEVFNEKFLYSGEIDRLLMVNDIPSLVDYKTGGWKWMQLVAYWKALPKNIQEKIKQLSVFDLKKGVLETLSVTDEKFTSEWENFLVKRGEIKSRFSL